MAQARKTNRASFGNVTKLPSGRWRARYPAPDGSPMSAPQTFETSADAHDHIAAVRHERNRGTYTDHRRGERLLSEYAREWIDNGGARGKLAIRTQELYEDLLTRHIEPSIGRSPVGKITPAAVRSWYTAQGKELAQRAAQPRKDASNTAPRIATGASRQRQAYSFLKAVMNTAVSDGMLGRNPCQIQGAGQVAESKRPLMSVEQFEILVSAHPADLQPLLRTMFAANLRLGEVVALTRKDFDSKASKLTVRGQVIYSRSEGEVLLPTKTDSERVMDLPADVTAAVLSYLSSVPRALPGAPLFVRADGRKLTRAQLTHAWKKARTAVELPEFHLHDLRHSGLTLKAHLGWTTRELMHDAGHSTPAMVMRYQHVAVERGPLLAGRLNDAMTGTSN
jgi:integrase